MQVLNLDLIDQAVAFLKPRIIETPLEESPALSALLGVPVQLKLEMLQRTGSFKLRGAFFRLSLLHPGERREGVITCSAGNHGWALAYAGKELGVPVTVYVPASVDPSKRAGIESLGATVVQAAFAGYDETDQFARVEAARLGRPFISPFDDDAIIAGNGGSLAAEILEANPAIKNFIVPVGGGGLAAGIGFYAKQKIPNFRLICCQHSGSPALRISLDRGFAVTEMPAIETAAGGIEGGIGSLTFSYLKDLVDQVVLVDEAGILEGVRWCLRELHYLVEPSSAVVIAACLAGGMHRLEGPTAVVLSGRNVAFETVRRIVTD